ncbi:uncharacterized protein LOC132306174 isoform X2 [Cornus florida]|uniref:uncharacterized protein LOC132306174 isoform X2 n=1 Tax=Cornus florida TaxID=4283 RepID=UPI0028A1B074|nr:uncharacterized protein LOC132306174 isoform X2 [Cornus florida]
MTTIQGQLNMRKKKLSGQQKRQELEKEISTLSKMLDHEQKVHEILEQVHSQQDVSSLCIPNFLPPKMKELLAELAMVDDEIARLESQISQLQNDLSCEKEASKESKWKQFQHETLNNPKGYSSLPPNPSPTNKGVLNGRVVYETKALHFISKAIKGDYFSSNEQLRNSTALSNQKENHFHDEVVCQDKAPRRSGMLKPPSPLREPRNLTPKRERNVENPSELPPRALASPIQSEEESIHKWSPNKLSENIMKFLIFVYVRLLRNSRAVELEKTGPTSRTANISLGSRSFRVDTVPKPKASLKLQKESKQQDPYDIFEMEESIPRDIGPYKNLVRFTSSSLDPKYISNPSFTPLFQRLRVLMNSLQKVDLRSLTTQQKLAFWINIYNACIMHGFLQYGVPSSPEKLLTLMNKATLNIGGNTINAHTIEHFILRKPASVLLKEIFRKGGKDDTEAIVRELYGLDSSDPNVTFALCCGSHSSPAVKIYTGDGVSVELEKSKLEYLLASIAVTSTKRIALPELLLQNMHDFAQDVDSLLQWVCHQLPTSGSLRKSMVDCFRGLNRGKISSIVDKIPYEFEFQYLLPI